MPNITLAHHLAEHSLARKSPRQRIVLVLATSIAIVSSDWVRQKARASARSEPRQVGLSGVECFFAEGVAYHSPGLFAEGELPWVQMRFGSVTLKALHNHGLRGVFV